MKAETFRKAAIASCILSITNILLFIAVLDYTRGSIKPQGYLLLKWHYFLLIALISLVISSMIVSMLLGLTALFMTRTRKKKMKWAEMSFWQRNGIFGISIFLCLVLGVRAWMSLTDKKMSLPLPALYTILLLMLFCIPLFQLLFRPADEFQGLLRELKQGKHPVFRTNRLVAFFVLLVVTPILQSASIFFALRYFGFFSGWLFWVLLVALVWVIVFVMVTTYIFRSPYNRQSVRVSGGASFGD